MSNDPASGSGDPTTGSPDPDALEDRIAELDSRVEDVRAATASLDDEVDELIRDVRDRVIQVKRETDEKAPHDHDHPDLASGIERLGATVESLGSDLADVDAATDVLEGRIERVEERTTRGFSNFEDVLEYLIETTDSFDAKVEQVASATLDLRKRLARLTESEARRALADRLRATANEHGVADARCVNCGGTVDLRLLSLPECPHCDVGFTELEPRRGLFRSSRLHTGERPALEGEVAAEPPDLSAIVADEAKSPPPVAEFEARPERDAPATDDDTDTGEAPIVEAEPADKSPQAGDALDVEEVSGVGPTYAEQLRAAGVETAGELATSDPERLAAEADIDRGRVDILVRRAGDALEEE